MWYLYGKCKVYPVKQLLNMNGGRVWMGNGVYMGKGSFPRERADEYEWRIFKSFSSKVS